MFRAAGLFGMIALCAYGQTTPPVTYTIMGSGYLTVEDPAALSYLQFFGQVQDFGTSALTPEAKVFLGLSDEEFRKLLDVTLDLATQSKSFSKEMAELIFEARMQIVEADAVSPALTAKMHELNGRWTKAILNHAEQLKLAYGETRFRTVDDFVRSGKPLFETGWQPLVKVGPVPVKR